MDGPGPACALEAVANVVLVTAVAMDVAAAGVRVLGRKVIDRHVSEG